MPPRDDGLIEVRLDFDVCPIVVLVDEVRFPRRAAELQARADALREHRAEVRRRNAGRPATPPATEDPDDDFCPTALP